MFKGRIFSRYYKLFLYHNSEPSAYFKTGLFGKLKIVFDKTPSRLEKVSKEECYEELEKRRKELEDYSRR